MVILVEETIKTFGYAPNDLALQSGKRIVVICDECGNIRFVQKRAYSSLCRTCTCRSYEFRSKISKARKGMVFTEEHKRRISEAGKGRKHTKEQTQKISSANRGKRRSKATRKILSEQKMGVKNPMYGKHHTAETRKKIRKNHAHLSGKDHPHYGISPSEETRHKLSLANKGKIISEEHRKILSESKKGKGNPMFGKCGEEHPNYGKHPSEETRKKMREARKHRKFPNHHTKPERIFEEICGKYDLHFKYTGDGSLWIGKDRALNPDFIQADGQKIVVEVMGEWWHSPILNPKVPVYATLDYRKKHYKKYGWVPIFVWETDLLREDAEQFVLSTLKREVGI